MKNIINLFILFLLVTACTETIDLELNEGDNEKLVVDAWITNELKTSSVKLALSTSYFHNEKAPVVTDAIVEIQGANEIYMLTHQEDGVYTLPANYQGEVGQTYKLKITHKDKVYTASATMNRVSPVDGVDYFYNSEYEIYEILLYAQELAGEGDAYLFKTFKNGTLMADTLANTSFVNDEFVDGNYIDGAVLGYGDFAIGDTIMVESWSIADEAFDFFTAISLETAWRGGIFDTPPANTPTNMEGGALGFFNVSAVERNFTVIE